MCVTNIYVDRYPDGKEVEFRQMSYCENGKPAAGLACPKLSTFKNPTRNIQFGVPTTEEMMIDFQKLFLHTSPLSLSEDSRPANPGPVINQLDDSARETFPIGRPLEDTPELQQCKICKRMVLKTAIAAHVEECVKAKNKRLKKREEKEARERGKKLLATGNENGEDKDEDGDITDEDGDTTDEDGDTTDDAAPHRIPEDGSDSDGSRRTSRLTKTSALRPKRTNRNHKKERIIIVDSPPTPRTPSTSQAKEETFTVPTAPVSSPHDAALARDRAIVVDEIPLQRVDSEGHFVSGRAKSQANLPVIWPNVQESSESSHAPFKADKGKGKEKTLAEAHSAVEREYSWREDKLFVAKREFESALRAVVNAEGPDGEEIAAISSEHEDYEKGRYDQIRIWDEVERKIRDEIEREFAATETGVSDGKVASDDEDDGLERDKTLAKSYDEREQIQESHVRQEGFSQFTELAYEEWESGDEDVIRPYQYEDAESEKACSVKSSGGRSKTDLDAILDGVRGLSYGNEEEDEYERWLQRERTRKMSKRRSSGTKRTITESVGSDTDNEDFQSAMLEGVNELGSSARRLRRKVGERSSLIFDPPSIKEVDEEPENYEEVVEIEDNDEDGGNGQYVDKELPYYRYVQEDMDIDSDEESETESQVMGIVQGLSTACTECRRRKQKVCYFHNDPRVTLPKADGSSVQVNRTVDAAEDYWLPSVEHMVPLSSMDVDENDESSPEKVHPPTWEDHVGTTSGSVGIARDVYTESDLGPKDTPAVDPAITSHLLHAASYASTFGEARQDKSEWVWTCHVCNFGPIAAKIDEHCLDCYHSRCADCPVELYKLKEVMKQPYSRSSSVESLQSLVDSIFSTASLSSASTVAEANNAFQRVLVILKTDAALKGLYADSIAKTSVDKFNRNFGILLKRFAVDLEGEAKCWNEQRAAHFIRSRARIIAQRVVDSVYPSKHASQKIQNRNSEQDKAESSDDSDFDEEPDEFAELETFITGSAAFCKLRDNIRAFLGLEPSQEHAVLDASSCKLLGELPFAGEDYVYTIDEPVCYEKCPSPYLRNLWQMPSFSQKIRDFLFPEPPIAEGMSRVRWQCPCGDVLYDDYRELKPGAAKRMEDYLRRSCYKKCPGDSQSTTERVSSFGSSMKGSVTSIGQWIQSIKSGERPALVNTELRYYSDARTTRTPAHTAGEVFYLLLCHNSGIGAEIVKLRQPDICDVNNDHKLFSFLHEEYITLRKRWWTWISLWTLQSIKFVRFELFENELVDVKRVDEVPPPTKDNEYRHGPPNPPELNPPLGSTLLMHLFKHPELAGTRKHCLKKIPRKIRSRLAVVDEEDDAIGWGLQFVEGWSKKRLMYMTALTFGLSSFVVMILVSILGHDIQNAAAIASFMLSFVTIGVATAQAALHMS